MPGPAHAIIAMLLPDGHQIKNRLCLSLVSRSMLGFHGGTLTVLRVRSITNQQAATLASLVQRQRSLERLCVEDSGTFSLVTAILAQGAFRRVRELTLNMPPNGTRIATGLTQVRRLADAMQAPGALEALEMLAFRKTHWAPGTIQPLVHALATGAAPSLRSLDLGESGSYSNDDAEALAAMDGGTCSASCPLQLEVQPNILVQLFRSAPQATDDGHATGRHRARVWRMGGCS
jgi:hypothetical protein